MRFHLFFLLCTVALTSSANSQGITLYQEDFESQAYPDQAPLVAADGNASVSFNADSPIGATNAAGDAASGGVYMSTGSTLYTSNGTRGYITTPDPNFTAGSGNVGQLHSHTEGGFMLFSVGPLVNNVPTPIPVTTGAGDFFQITFDMYVQTPTTISPDLNVSWNTDLGVNVPVQRWDAYTTSSAGDNLSVTIGFTVDATTAAMTSIAPQIQMSEASGRTPFNTEVAQIDNFVIKQFEVIRGDANGDGAVTFLDIDWFIGNLASGEYLAEADANGDGFLNFLDISAFIAILAGG